MKSYFPMTIATIHIAIIKLSRNISQNGSLIRSKTDYYQAIGG